MIPHDLDLRMREQPFLQDALAPELMAAMHDRHLRREIGEVERLLDRGIAAADDDDILVAEEEAVAGRTGRNAEAAEMLLGRDAEPFRLRAGRDDERIAGVDLAAVAGEPERPLREIDRRDVVGDELRADMFGLRAHLLHQPRALDRRGEARIILDVGRDHELAAGLKTRDQHGFEHGAGRINGGGIAGRAGADDDEL